MADVHEITHTLTNSNQNSYRDYQSPDPVDFRLQYINLSQIVEDKGSDNITSLDSTERSEEARRQLVNEHQLISNHNLTYLRERIHGNEIKIQTKSSEFDMNS
jgi:hypothetical protein